MPKSTSSVSVLRKLGAALLGDGNLERSDALGIGGNDNSAGTGSGFFVLGRGKFDVVFAVAFVWMKRYPVCNGRIIGDRGLPVDVDRFDVYFVVGRRIIAFDISPVIERKSLFGNLSFPV